MAVVVDDGADVWGGFVGGGCVMSGGGCCCCTLNCCCGIPCGGGP